MKTPESLAALVDYGIVQEIVRPLMSGKEAQIYLVVADGEEVVAVEVSKLHRDVLRRRFDGVEVVGGDFLTIEGDALGEPFDRVVMNPPFAGGRAAAHVAYAASMLALHGKLVSVVPISCRDLAIDGFNVEVLAEIPNAFAGTGVDVLIVSVVRSEVPA